MKKNRSAYLYETYRDFKPGPVREAMKSNLEGESLIRRLVTPAFLMKQPRMTCRTDEIAGIIKRTHFSKSYTIDRIRFWGEAACLAVDPTNKLKPLPKPYYKLPGYPN
jgi:hypothetical protein